VTELTTPPIAPTRDAATIVLIRNGAVGIEVFMLVRHTDLDFASGAMVFPGGGVDPHDRVPEIRAYLPAGMDDVDDDELALRVAAIREAYEECGVLLVRPKGNNALLDAQRLRAIDERYAEARSQHRLDLGQVLREENLELAADLLIPLAHWITPASQPKRFDTRFYVAEAPCDHVAIHDGYESVESAWMTVEDICKDADAGLRHVMFPTRMNLERVGVHSDVNSALAAATQLPIVPVLPRLVEQLPNGRRLAIPPEAGYGVSDVIVTKTGMVRRNS
jgi:8-oxo-dGTP pyrophosphatase MutT (NUDIX family)